MPDTVTFSTLNYVILAVYIAGLILIGFRFSKRQKTTDDFFLAGRRMPWLAVAMSFYASVTSAMTFMALPGMAYRENVSLLVVALISPLVAPVLIFLLYPVYRRHGVTTSYEYIARRFGPTARTATSILFVLARLAWLGTVIYAPSLSLHVVTGIPLALACILIGLMATLYCAMGGLSAVIWTDVPQFLIMMTGAFWLAISLAGNVPDGFTGIVEAAHVADRLRLFDWSLHPLEMTAAAAALSYFFVLIHDYGIDQVSVQRLLAVRSDRGVTKAILFNAATDFIIIGTLLFIGLGMFVYYGQHPGVLPDDISGDRVLPFYIIHQLPNGVSGLLIAALFAAAMSSVDSGLNSITTVLINDILGPLSPRHAERWSSVRRARILNVGIGIVATAVAVLFFRNIKGILDMFLTYIGLFNAPILALFLLGILTRRAHVRGWLAGTAVSIVSILWLRQAGILHEIYFFPLSTLITVIISLAAGRILPPPSGPAVKGAA